jgi:antitoxin component of MazEF toxin-antitoxin module
MSEENKLPTVAGAMKDLEERKEFTKKDLEELEEYKSQGLPEIATLTPEVLKKIMEFYLEGRTYREISTTLRVKRVSVMYLAQRFNWWDLRRDYIEEMQNQITQRVIDSKLSSQTFLLKLVHNWERKMSKQIDSFQRSGEEPTSGVIDFKEVDKYLKTVEVLHKITADNANRLKAPQPSIGLNVGDGVTVEKNGNTLTISPAVKERTVAEMLKQIADAKRQEDEDRYLNKEGNK